MWLKHYASDVQYARESKIEIGENRNLWTELSSGNMQSFPREREASALIGTNWNQDWPYNELCPADAAGPGGRVYAGCVATAMAQVLKYWNKPITGQGTNTYYAGGYGYQTANFGATTYLWDQMPNSISSSNLPVATLLYHCAVSVNMNFAPDGSGSNGMLARSAMQNNFRYPNASYVQKQSYSTTNWKTCSKPSLTRVCPCITADRIPRWVMPGIAMAIRARIISTSIWAGVVPITAFLSEFHQSRRQQPQPQSSCHHECDSGKLYHRPTQDPDRSRQQRGRRSL